MAVRPAVVRRGEVDEPVVAHLIEQIVTRMRSSSAVGAMAAPARNDSAAAEPVATTELGEKEIRPAHLHGSPR
jgi:hypothetical protein